MGKEKPKCFRFLFDREDETCKGCDWRAECKGKVKTLKFHKGSMSEQIKNLILAEKTLPEIVKAFPITKTVSVTRLYYYVLKRLEKYNG